MNYHILVVDNDPFQCKTIKLAIEKLLRFEVTTTTSGREAAEILLSPAGNAIDLVILDLSMPDMDGMDVLDKVCPQRPDLPVIINTAYGDVKKAVEALQKGAVDFIEKKDGPERLKVSIENVRLMANLRKEVNKLAGFANNVFDFSDIIGHSSALNRAINAAKKGANSAIPILLQGESGVGKELFARAIHHNSPRAEKPFISLNCGAIPTNLAESVLFGHEKGSFTGAIEKTLGRFREANGGTLFLDEVGELPPEIQVKLLRALQNLEIEPVGAGRPVDVNVRIISATNKNLEKAVAEGRFREDLFYRLNVFHIEVPPLRQRREDVGVLVNHFIRRICMKEKKKIMDVDDSLLKILTEYSWPGNIRQLENAVYRAVVLCSGDRLTMHDFDNILAAISANRPEDVYAPDNVGYSSNSEPRFKTIAQHERDIIQKALDYYNYNISKVSKVLEIGRSTLYRKMKEYNIEMRGSVEDIEEFKKTRNG